MTKPLAQWEKSTQDLADYFVKRYFGKATECYWIKNNIGGVYRVNDHFFNIEDMADYIRNHYTKDEMFAHYEAKLNFTPEARRMISEYT